MSTTRSAPYLAEGVCIAGKDRRDCETGPRQRPRRLLRHGRGTVRFVEGSRHVSLLLTPKRHLRASLTLESTPAKRPVISLRLNCSTPREEGRGHPEAARDTIARASASASSAGTIQSPRPACRNTSAHAPDGSMHARMGHPTIRYSNTFPVTLVRSPFLTNNSDACADPRNANASVCGT